MAKNLVIVESPAKVKTIKKFLGSNYTVVASNGHVRDLPKSTMGLDIENDYEPKYITIRGKGDKLAELRKEVKKADKVYLATDPDREGEAISWHLAAALNLDSKKMKRITFNEITKNAVKASIKSPRAIDLSLVDSQQTRRILDRMVGYSISPVLWKKVKRGLSAGRVQSVALRMICDREDEINAFIPEEYWSLDAKFLLEGQKKPIVAKYYGTTEGKKELKSEKEVENILNDLKKTDYFIKEVKRGERVKKAPLPFITSTLQQEASKTLNFSTQKTMRIAQQLYEGVDIKGKGTIGLITYLRTDSIRVSDEAKIMAKDFIESNYGADYVAQEELKKKTEGKIQDAHESIRPTNLDLTPTVVKDQLPRDAFRLYQLIWKRFVASRMTAAKYETISIKIQGGEHLFSAATSKMLFDGFMSVYVSSDDKEEANNVMLSKIDKDTNIEFDEFESKQHFTQPPAHYTEAALVKALEEQGIGRPSTYAPTISTIIARRYVAKENKNLYVTELGEAVNDIMKASFPVIVDMSFTANLESLLDKIEEGVIPWKTVVRNFYPDLAEAVKIAEEELEKIEIRDEETDVKCELCGRNMVIKYGPHGKFMACPGFPECKNTKPYFEKIGVPCPICGKDVVIKKTKKGRKYFGCENNPECDFISWQPPLVEKCPECGKYMLKKGNKAVCSDEQCGYSEEIKK
ncbi:MAG: type I DNA topoisomerase [Lachnospiraceae bacterium]|nr:type I DNA topoisomerase [Lachnospiraceae bacterium]MBQ4069094.1 type I DNA topoisomerase [Lachnospiraceae bacterium]